MPQATGPPIDSLQLFPEWGSPLNGQTPAWNTATQVFDWSTGGGMTVGDPVTGGTAKSVLFVNASGNLAQDSAFLWDATPHALGLGVSPTYRLDVLNATTGQTAANRVANVSNAGATFDTTAAAITNYASYFSNTATRSAGANDLTNIALYASASGAQNNYGLIVENGSVGIGILSPGATLDVKGASTSGIRATTPNAANYLAMEATNAALSFIGSIGHGFYVGASAYMMVSNGAVFTLPRGTAQQQVGLNNNASVNFLAVAASNVPTEEWRTVDGILMASLGPVSSSNVRPKLNLYLTQEGSNTFAGSSPTSGTTVTNYERLAQYADSANSVFRIEAENGGSGVLRNLALQGGGGNVGVGTLAPDSKLTVSGTGTYSAAGVSSFKAAAHTVTFSGADPTTYATFYSVSLAAMTLVGTNANQTITDAAVLAVAGMPIESTNVILTNAHGIYVPASAATGAVNAYGLTVNAPTGATNNYAAAFLGGNVGIGTSAPLTKLHVEHALGQQDWTVARADNNAYGLSITNNLANTVNSFTPYSAIAFRLQNNSISGVVGVRHNAQNDTGRMFLAPRGSATSQPEPGLIAFENGTVRIGSQLTPSDSAPVATLEITQANTYTALFLGGSVGIGTASPDRLLHAETSDAVTAAVTYAERISHITTAVGNADVGFGVGVEYEIENAAGTNQIAATWDVLWRTATDDAENADAVLSLMRAGTKTEAFRFTSGGYFTWEGGLCVQSDATNSTATMSDLGDLTAPVESGKRYEFTLVLLVSESVAGEGIKIDFDGGTATMTAFRAHGLIFDTSGLLVSAQVSVLATDIVSATITGDSMIIVKGYIRPSSSGTVKPRFAQNSHVTGTVTVYEGSSFCVFEKAA